MKEAGVGEVVVWDRVGVRGRLEVDTGAGESGGVEGTEVLERAAKIWRKSSGPRTLLFWQAS